MHNLESMTAHNDAPGQPPHTAQYGTYAIGQALDIAPLPPSDAELR